MVTEAKRITQKLSELSGIELTSEIGMMEGYQYIDFHPLVPEAPWGFRIRIRLFWKRFEISFIPDNFAGYLIASMGNSDSGKKAFSSCIKSIIADNARVSVVINGKNEELTNPESWGKMWNTLEINVEKFCDGSLNDFSYSEPLIIEWASRFLNMIIPLLPIEEVPDNELPCALGIPEGAKIRVFVNKYERSRINRTTCISIHGCYCHVCGVSFDEVYGELGKGYIEVHHATPVSEMGDGYIVDPTKDLIPVCPNCHAMIHRRNPPLTVEEIKKSLKK